MDQLKKNDSYSWLNSWQKKLTYTGKLSRSRNVNIRHIFSSYCIFLGIRISRNLVLKHEPLERHQPVRSNFLVQSYFAQTKHSAILSAMYFLFKFALNRNDSYSTNSSILLKSPNRISKSNIKNCLFQINSISKNSKWSQDDFANDLLHLGSNWKFALEDHGLMMEFDFWKHQECWLFHWWSCLFPEILNSRHSICTQ